LDEGGDQIAPRFRLRSPTCGQCRPLR
jgi:hypothetical protein